MQHGERFGKHGMSYFLFKDCGVEEIAKAIKVPS